MFSTIPSTGSSAKVGPELGRELAAGVLGDRHRRERDRRQEARRCRPPRAPPPGPARDRCAFGVARLLRHVRDRLDPGVGDHPDRDPEREVAPARRRCRARPGRPAGRGRRRAPARSRRAPTWVSRSATASTRLSRADSSVPLTLSGASSATRPMPKKHVAGPVAERLPEDRQVVGHEEGRDRDGDDVGEHLRPGRRGRRRTR